MNITINKQETKYYYTLGIIGVQGFKPSQYTKPRRLSNTSLYRSRRYVVQSF